MQKKNLAKKLKKIKLNKIQADKESKKIIKYILSLAIAKLMLFAIFVCLRVIFGQCQIF